MRGDDSHGNMARQGKEPRRKLQKGDGGPDSRTRPRQHREPVEPGHPETVPATEQR